MTDIDDPSLIYFDPKIHVDPEPLAARIALAHYGNILKIMSFDIEDEICIGYLRNYQKDFIEAGNQSPPQNNKITIAWLEEQWPI